jgi:hypothetical protein
MSALKNMFLSTAMLASVSTPSHAFLTELVVGMTSVTNNLIDSTESVTNNTVNTASTTMLSLSSNPGKMADRIGLMADRIGFMADRIVTTEGIMAGLAHKIIDRTTEPRVVQQYASHAPAPMPSYYKANGYANPNGTPYSNAYQPPRPAQVQHISAYPYIAAKSAPQAPSYMGYGNGNNYGHPRAQPDTSQYSASNMIYGISGATYTAALPAAASMQNMQKAQPTYQSGYGFSARPALNQISHPSNTVAGNSCGFSYGVARSC